MRQGDCEVRVKERTRVELEELVRRERGGTGAVDFIEAVRATRWWPDQRRSERGAPLNRKRRCARRILFGDNETDGASFKMLLVTSSLCRVEPAATPHSWRRLA